MDQTVLNDDISPFRVFTAEEWGRLRADTPMTLTAHEIEELRSLNDRIEIEEVERIYLPLSRLLWLYVAATQQLFSATARFLGDEGFAGKVPYIIGLAGSVAVGKSTTARLLKALLARWPTTPKVDLVTTDGFLFPNSVLRAEGLMDRKGFPESYDTKAILRFLSDIKAGKRHVRAPLYSHIIYDIVDGETIEIDRPDILIVEGLNVLQTSNLPRHGRAIPFVSDYFDFSIYVDADEDLIHDWYVDRFMRLRETAFRDPQSFFHNYATLSEGEALKVANRLWGRVNLPNLLENIVPTRQRSDLILTKGPDHSIETVALRRL